ncbi:MAG: 2-oxoglutarate dehydrogenase E1 component (EC [uncultured Thiotrichaceae bacterium]|uniref:2-oxoglutarate dehydrogenase E1 component n=1 Tax=uncultured Thiotrichaceae bacterium TaxID=298394 RepID=A0A6S6TQ63_9GAMM|nr:MAG: 2-oxoglutarate dehydrogenase E1 component (EC [uncultured Thiotrichaceae bacterium]
MNNPKTPINTGPENIPDKESHLDGNSALYLESLYESYLADPGSVSKDWQDYFSDLKSAEKMVSEAIHSDIRERFKNIGFKQTHSASASSNAENPKQIKVLQLINSYRFLGHLRAKTNPLDESGIAGIELPEVPELTLAYHGLDASDLSKTFQTGSLVGEDTMTLKAIIDQLEAAYCDAIGSQYMYISNVDEKRWIQQRLADRVIRDDDYSSADRKKILKKLIAAETLERYLHTKYVGQKRFSLEGGDSLIPLLDTLVQHAGTNGVREIVLGMAHRGRLNVLINIMGKSPAVLFQEFEGNVDHGGRTGDVKYHLGYSSDMATPGESVHLALAFNPSHLEIVGPVVEGAVRARQDRRPVNPGDFAIPVVIHGDAALAGQGVNMETLNMSETRGYRTHGTIHIVINNQIGFTTSTQNDSRSTEYCTDLAKMVGAPVFHVNGDRPEAVIDVTKIAVDYRNTFNKDVFIDLVCYRRHGHNEADEPSATQPMMYKKIKALATTQARYAEQLIKDNVIDANEVKALIKEYRDSLAEGAPTVPHLMEQRSQLTQDFPVDWGRFKNATWTSPATTQITEERFKFLGQRISEVPEGFKMNARVGSINSKRAKMAEGEFPTDWGFGENLAYAALVQEGFPIRLSGEDCGRGTFFHRHAVFHNQEDGSDHIPLQHITEDQASFTVIDSLLSEEAVLAFEYGYATTEADMLVIWESQFGDFANGAQVVIDQFISSAEQKWGLLSGLVMLLPHGYEGMGPEHSSARLERYLQLCAQENMQVCVPTTPAQVFHMLRRQMIRRYRKPLIVMTPKSLLRHPLATSEMEEFTERGFQNVIDEVDTIAPIAEIENIVLCSGKIYYELLEKRRSEDLQNTAIIRLEQLYPFPNDRLCEIFNQYSAATTCTWCQEEPFNQGAWLNIQPWLFDLLQECDGNMQLKLASRPAMAAPAEGSHKAHVVAQTLVVNTALGLE